MITLQGQIFEHGINEYDIGNLHTVNNNLSGSESLSSTGHMWLQHILYLSNLLSLAS